jgi:histidyl-tRNA synthetase
MQTTKVEWVPGVSDALPKDYEINHSIQEQVLQCFRSFGYRPIDVPILEHTDLFLKKSGEEIIDRLYDFVYRNRRLCLRPEMTASVMRAYVDHLQGQALPLRLQYAGPVFRYEKPEQARYRQFTQIGVEMIGASGAMADAEVIWMACQGLEHLGITNYQVVIGHIGVLNRFLDNLELDSRLRNFLLTHMETLKQANGKQVVQQHLAALYPDFQPDLPLTDTIATDQEELGTGSLPTQHLVSLFRGMNHQEAKAALLDLLASLNIPLSGNRDPQEIAERLLIKLKRQDQTPRIGQALDFIHELAQLQGEPSATLAAGAQLLGKYGIDAAPLEDLRAIAETLTSYNLSPNQIHLDLGLIRGIQYYTGMIFEIYHGNPDQDWQLCGGGRYDELVAVLGGSQDIPATGFAYGLERLRLALDQEGINYLPTQPCIDVLLMATSSESHGSAIATAGVLRQSGLKVELDVCGRTVAENCHYAQRQGIPFCAWVDATTPLTSQVVLQHLQSAEQHTLAIADVASFINRSHP